MRGRSLPNNSISSLVLGKQAASLGASPVNLFGDRSCLSHNALVNAGKEPPEPRRGEPGRGARAVGQGIAATAGYGLGGLSGAVLGAVVSDALVEMTGRAWDEITSARRRSAASLVLQAADEMGEAPNALLSRALADPDTSAMLADALAAAAHTLNERKVAALSRAVANGLRDDAATVDEARLAIQALAQLEAPHIRLLLLFVRSKHGHGAVVLGQLGHLKLIAERRLEWTCVVKGVDPTTRRHLLSFMLGLGLFTRQPAGPDEGELGAEDILTSHDVWAPTSFGIRCAAYLLGHREPLMVEWTTQRTEKYPGGERTVD